MKVKSKTPTKLSSVLFWRGFDTARFLKTSNRKLPFPYLCAVAALMSLKNKKRLGMNIMWLLLLPLVLLSFRFVNQLGSFTWIAKLLLVVDFFPPFLFLGLIQADFLNL